MKKILLIMSMVAVVLSGCASKTADNPGPQFKEKHQTGGPRIGGPGMGGGHRPNPSPALQALIDETVPSFKQYVFVNEKAIRFNIISILPKTLRWERNILLCCLWQMRVHLAPTL